MAAPTTPSILVPIAIAALIAWRFYSRVRRMVGRQRLTEVRPWITVTLFPLLTAGLLLGSFARPHPQTAQIAQITLLALLGGVAVGVCLGIYGLRLTRFEQTPEGLFYTPSAHLGIGLSAVLLLRIGYRMLQVYVSSGGSSGPPPGYTQSPLTLVIFGALAGYYVTYAIGLLRWRKRVRSGTFTIAADDTTT